ncbi:glycosyltransferase family 2 protein [Chryseobacterium formosus]|uniref:Glycosyltransferase family 2 protein n=1 Tax=Chryseobacterium formosus TaxID=1537363 RepID=A0ABT3XVT0_9FLAO|nr:glycosyltransferase family 2 protein [Chryseobacterium formosus]MCX8525791.1 glycosyltransferase family 2 protein [Chryseobacterium formosus]
MTKISVALCTYNGEKFIHEQIDSILNQSLKVDEIIVCDDGSTDKTQNILSDYQNKFPDIFQIYINEKNLRSVKNFEKAISLCKGEIIFLSDQDDIWERDKVKVLLNYFNDNPSINAICSNGNAINEKGETLDKMTIWEVPTLLKNADIKIDYFNILAFIENIATGAGMAFRSVIREKILPIPIKKGFHHDEWIALITAHDKSFTMIPEKLFRYRIHENQQVGGVIYENNESTKNRLAHHFNLFSEDKTFSQYKKFLKRLSQSYSKHKELSIENDNENTSLSKDIIKRCRELFDYHRQKMKEKYPFRFSILNLADLFSKKRKIQ